MPKSKPILTVLSLIALWCGDASAGLSPLKLTAFQISGAMIQNNSPTSYVGHLAWIPSLNLGPIGAHLELGVTNNLTINAEGFLSYSFIPLLSIEAGGGLANWLNTGGSNPSVGGNLVLSIPVFLDRVYVGFSRYLHPTNPSNILKFGVGLSF